MSKMNSMKQMPYRLDEGAIETMKMRSMAAVARAASERQNRGYSWVWQLGVGVAVAAFALLAVWNMALKAEQTSYDRLIEQVASAPVDVIYEMSADVVEYAEDITLL